VIAASSSATEGALGLFKRGYDDCEDLGYVQTDVGRRISHAGCSFVFFILIMAGFTIWALVINDSNPDLDITSGRIPYQSQ
jgi:hypothetical protein